MTDTDQNDQDAPTDDDSAATAAAPTRVPNVREGAVSGLDHQPLNGGRESELNPEADEALEEETADDTGQGDGEPDDRTPSEVEADKNAEGNSGDIASGAYVESDTAGTGEATNDQTGEVTAPGDPLPDAPDQGTGGTPLDPPQPGADADGFGGDAPAPADASPEGDTPDGGSGPDA